MSILFFLCVYIVIYMQNMFSTYTVTYICIYLNQHITRVNQFSTSVFVSF